MPALRRLTLAVVALAAIALAASPADAGCRVARDHACARPGATCRVDGRKGVCETTHPLRRPHVSGCVCAIPIGGGGHGGGGHRR